MTMKKSDKEAYSGKKPPPVADEEVAEEGEKTSLHQVEGAAAAASSLEKNEQVEVDNRTKANGLSNVNNGPPLKTPEDDDIEEGGGGEHSKVMKQPPPVDSTNADDMTGKGTIAVIPGRNNVHNDNDDNSSSDESVIQPGFMFIPGPNYTGTGIHTGYHSDHEDNNDTTDNNLSEMGITATTEVVPESHIVPSAYLVQDVEVAQAEEVKPFLKQKEGKFTILIVGFLLLSVAILVAVFLSGQGSGVSEVKNDVLLPSEAPTTSPTFDPRPTLDIVRERGVVNCGIEDLQEGDVNLNEFNIDQCRQVAAAIFGDPTKINLVIVGRNDQYEKLYDRQVDVLFTGNTFTLEKLIREPTTGQSISLGSPYYVAEYVYIGLQTFVKCVNEQKRYDECAELSICAVDTPEIRHLTTSYFPPSFISFGLFPEMESSLKNGTCNVLVSDTYRIYGSKTGLQDDLGNGTYVMSDNYISRNMLSSAVRTEDRQWFDVVEGSSKRASFRAAQVGISKGECPMNATDNEISFNNVARCVGNIREIFESRLARLVVSLGQDAKLPSIDAPNFASLECDECNSVMEEHSRPKQVKERGVLNCAVFMDPRYNVTMTSLPTLVGVKYCEMMAVAIFQGDPARANITFIDEIDYLAFPKEFDIVAGVPYDDIYDSGIDLLGNMIPTLPYYYHDKYLYNGSWYKGLGAGLACVFDLESIPLAAILLAVHTAVVYAQRQGITRVSFGNMPLIYLLGDSLTFMLRDVVRYAGNYDDIFDEALAESDGLVDRGWNSVVPGSSRAAQSPIFYCDYSDSCGDCFFYEELSVFLC